MDGGSVPGAEQMGEEMNCWKKFDKVFTLAFTGLPDRARLLDAELERVGLKAERIWQFPTPYDRAIQSVVWCGGGMQCIPYFNSGMGHYRAVKTAYELGARTCLILEDDIRFLKDLNRLEETVDSTPEDWSVALLDVLKADKDPISIVQRSVLQDHVNPHWCRSWGNPRSFGCYALTRPAMEWLIGRIENPVLHPGEIKLINVDLSLRQDRVAPGLNIYYAAPNAAIQVCIGDGNFNSAKGNLNKYYDFYRAIGVKIEDYAEAGG